MTSLRPMPAGAGVGGVGGGGGGHDCKSSSLKVRLVCYFIVACQGSKVTQDASVVRNRVSLFDCPLFISLALSRSPNILIQRLYLQMKRDGHKIDDLAASESHKKFPSCSSPESK